jgi:hypothetical protein
MLELRIKMADRSGRHHPFADAMLYLSDRCCQGLLSVLPDINFR